MEQTKKKKENKKIEYWYNFKVYLKLLKPYSLGFILLIFVILAISAVRVGEKFLFKILIDEGTKFAASQINNLTFFHTLLLIGIGFGVTILVKTVGQWLQLHLINNLETSMMFDIKKKFFNHIIGLSHKFHTTHKTGSMISRLGRGGRAVEAMTDFIVFNSAPLIFQLALVGGSLIYFDKVSALIVTGMAIIFIIYSLLITNLSQQAKVETNSAEDRERGGMADFLMNVDSIKYFGKENRIKSLFEKLAKTSREKLLKNWNYLRWQEGGQTFIVNISLFILMYISITKFLNNEITIGTIVFTYTIYGIATEPLFGLVWGIRRFYDAMADFQSLFEYDKVKNEIKDHENAKNLVIQKGEVEFKNVEFQYHNRKIINNLNLKIEANEKVALVGHSGSGKTTLVKLLYRFYDVNSGGILIDGKNVRNFKQESLRGELSIVPQECMLFDDTIYNNIAFSKPNATRQEVLRAIKFAQLDSFVATLPQKENTIVGERGVKLSGGEKQRVSIARALLGNKKILVLDEATSALDSKTEHEIQQDLARLMQGRTSIIIAHRLSTIMSADKIVVLNKGRVAQIGRHNELIRQSGIYKELWSLQKGGYIGN